MNPRSTIDGAKRWLRDWWRGYSEADVRSVVSKMQQNRRPGAVIPVSDREWKALADQRTWNVSVIENSRKD